MDSAFSVLKADPDPFEKEMRLAAVIKYYELGILSQSKAAALSGISREEFVEAAGRFEVAMVQTGSDEFEEELSRD